MAPWIIVLGAMGGVVALACAVAVFLLPVPPLLAALLYLFFGTLFMASVVIFGRLLVIES